ncbi:MAG: hypothetical protein MUO60_13725 [Clostridiaceae bacterium]|nr:hypothetical protein [Clostridiaceae bacterium]
MLDKKLLIELQEYVEMYTTTLSCIVLESEMYAEQDICEYLPNVELNDFINSNRKPSFNNVLFSFIDNKGLSDSAIYKKAGIDRRHFSKIRSNPKYRLSKNTAIALCLALELNKEDTDKLLSSAGYSLSNSDTFDLIIQFCVDKKIYDIYDVNHALDYFSLKPLIGVLA